MSEEKTYNGWANYATWRIKLEMWDDGSFWEGQEGNFEDIHALAESIKESTDDMLTNFGENDSGFAIDYARAFVSDVDFYEIAHSIAEDYPELLAERTDEEENDDSTEPAHSVDEK